jgi:hypothetical protein
MLSIQKLLMLNPAMSVIDIAAAPALTLARPGAEGGPP